MFLSGLLVIVIEELICLLALRVAGRPRPALLLVDLGVLVVELVVVEVLLVEGASKSTAMISSTELIMSYLLGCCFKTDEIQGFLILGKQILISVNRNFHFFLCIRPDFRKDNMIFDHVLHFS